MRATVYSHTFPLSRGRAELLEARPFNRLPECPKCQGGRLLFNNLLGHQECPNCGYTPGAVSSLPLVKGPERRYR